MSFKKYVCGGRRREKRQNNKTSGKTGESKQKIFGSSFIYLVTFLFIAFQNKKYHRGLLMWLWEEKKYTYLKYICLMLYFTYNLTYIFLKYSPIEWKSCLSLDTWSSSKVRIACYRHIWRLLQLHIKKGNFRSYLQMISKKHKFIY